MKTIFKAIILLAFCSALNSQVDINSLRNKISLKGPVQLPDTAQMKLIVDQVLQIYGNSFIYYDELKSGSYKFNIRDFKKSDYSIQSFTKDKKVILTLPGKSGHLVRCVF